MMKKTLLVIALTAMAVTGASAQMLVINEVYPGGGSGTVTTTSYTRDFVELYNNSGLALSLAGYSLQYAPAAATGDFTAGNVIINFGVGSFIGANDYLTISTGGAGSQGATLAAGTGAGFATYVNPTTGGTGASLSASAGAVRLYNTNTSTVVDLVGYGTVTPNTTTMNPKAEGTSATAPSSANNTSLNRTNFVDTNNNSADFTALMPSPNAGTTSVVVPAVTGVPEPSTWAAMVGGCSLLALVLRRRRRVA